MTNLAIKNAPQLSTIDGTEKIPTGGKGDFSVTLKKVSDFAVENAGKVFDPKIELKADKLYVDDNLDLKADKLTTYSKEEVDDKLVTTIKEDRFVKTWSGRNQEQKNRDFKTVEDYGYVGDGSYHPLSEKYNTLALAKFAYANIADKIDSLDQSIDWCAIQSALTANIGSTVYMLDSNGFIDRTILVPRGVRLIGNGEHDYWTGSTTGTIINTYGSGNGKQWTDIGSGADNLDFTPMFVFAGGSSVCQNIVLKTSEEIAGWDVGFFNPATKRNQLIDCYALGRFKKTGLYLDATWSDRNEFLISLHPEVSPTSMNEFYCQGGIYQGHKAFILKGTDRNPDDYTTETWLWSWGGTSDLVFSNTAFRPRSNLIDNDSTILYLNARIKNSAGAGQGIKFNDCWYRGASADIMFDFDHINRVYISGYAEASNTIPAKFTSNSTAISFKGRFISNYIMLDGVKRTTTNSSGEVIACSLDNSNGLINDVTVQTDSGYIYAGSFAIGGNYIRPQSHNTGRLGRGGNSLGQSFSFERVYATSVMSGYDNSLNLTGSKGIDFAPTGAKWGYWDANRISFGLSSTELLGIYANGVTINTSVIPSVTKTHNLGSSNYTWNRGFFANLRVTDYAVYADNAAAKAGGLSNGEHYRTATGQVMVVY